MLLCVAEGVFTMRTQVLVAVIALGLVTTLSLASGQSTAEVFAFQAPNCENTSAECAAFLEHVLPNISGIGKVVHWTDIDQTVAPTGTTITYSYNWPALANFLEAYINSNTNDPSFNWTSGCFGGKACKIMLIVQPETDGLGAGNAYTPAYVYNNQYATDVGADQPQDLSACGEFPGTGSLPYSGTMVSGDVVIWNYNSCQVAALKTGSTVSCNGSNLGTSLNTTGFPVVYEKPIMTAYQAFLSSLSSTFNSSTGTYANVGQYIVYVRAGLSVGGENYPVCNEVNGPLSDPSWQSNFSVAAGVLVTPTTAQGNAGGYTYLSLKAGTTGTSHPTWNQTPGSRNTSDGGVTWANEGVVTPGTNAAATWPGPNGEFGTTGQPNAFQDNGFLGHWYAGINTQGYVSQMVEFLAGLNSTFSWDFATNFGPGQVITYPDADAVLAYVEGDDKVGFGMESLSVEDPVTYALGVFPTSREDWIANFANYPAPTDVPVHHLQTNTPGTDYLAAGYSFTSITPSDPAGVGDATVSCGTVDCSWFFGMWTYITNNNFYNGPWASPCTGEGSGASQCPSDKMVITSSLTNTGGTGTIWSPNYWPDTLVFSVDRGVTVLEVFECDLDYAFNVVTTTHVSVEGSGGGCAGWGVAGPSTPYQTALSSAQ